ncbi:MAG: purine-nucleoside phosphorylase [Bacteroidota bacterium]
MLDKIKQTASYIKEKTDFSPEFGIVLGSGLGGLVNEIEILHALEYSTIPNFPVSTVKGHGGKLILGNLGGKKVIALQGRFHLYEGYTMQEVTFPIRVFKALGISNLILSNAAGGMNPDFHVGDIVFINDHINLMPSNPLIGKIADELGPRFPDMSEPYDPKMIALAKQIADKHSISSHVGVYAAVSGPCFETPAEYRYIRTIGADLVGMSTVPEVIVARHGGTPCFAVSIVTDLGGFETAQKVSHEEVLEVATAAEKKLTKIIKEMLEKL